MEKIIEYLSVNRYRKTEKISQDKYPLKKSFSSSDFEVQSFCEEDRNSGKKNIKISVLLRRKVKQAAVSIDFEVEGWSEENYVFAPAALYNGNRFYSVKRDYAPYYTDSDREKCALAPVITDVPRLGGERSVAQLTTGDLSTPCVGWFSPHDNKGHLIFWKQKNEAGIFGLTVREMSGEKASFSISSPCVREKTKYGMCSTEVESDDEARNFKAGDKLNFEISVFDFNCESKTEFLNKFFEIRSMRMLPYSLPQGVPWSYAFSLLEDKYNRRNWLSEGGFYKSSEAVSGICRQWQTGWVGGGMNILPQLLLGNSESVEKSKKTLDFIFGSLQHPSGFLYGIYCDSKLYGDRFDDVDDKSVTMSRKNADALYFVAKELLCLEKMGEPVKESWKKGLLNLADAFVDFYSKNGDFAQLIDMDEFKPFAAKTASAAIAPAGLALCFKYFSDKKYLDCACQAAQRYYDEYVKEGFTNGGPGEILGCPDSESAFGMFESLIVLYSVTGDKKWLDYAKDTGSLCASWCVSYDYEYEKDTQFYRRRISTNGAVWASVQNKHAAPGICTLSGASLFRMFRATEDLRYLELCRDISHNITQFLSTYDNPVYYSYIFGRNRNVKIQKKLTGLCADVLMKAHKSGKAVQRLTDGIYKKFTVPVGCMGERCNLSDWEGKENIGELPGGSCWCEVSTMLVWLEVPAVYVNPDTGFVYALDHVECSFKDGLLILKNPTSYDAIYRVFSENSCDRQIPLEDTYMLDLKSVKVKANESVSIKL